MDTAEKEEYFKSARRNLMGELDSTSSRASDMFDKSLITQQVPSLASRLVITSSSLLLTVNNVQKDDSKSDSYRDSGRDTNSSVINQQTKQSSVLRMPSSLNRTTTNTVARINPGNPSNNSATSMRYSDSSSFTSGTESDLEMLDVSQVQPQFTEDPTMNIFLRLRPFSGIETQQGENQGSISVCEEDRKFLVVVPPKGSNAHKNSYVQTTGLQKSLYGFTHVFDSGVGQEKFFEKTVIPALHQFIAEGRNHLLFTYGVTGSGKTYTLLGTPTQLGILPRAIDILFNTIRNNIWEEKAASHRSMYFVKPQTFDACYSIDEIRDRREEIDTRNRILDTMKPTRRDGALSKASSSTTSSLGIAPSEFDLFGYFGKRKHDKHVLPVNGASLYENLAASSRAASQRSEEIDASLSSSGTAINQLSKRTQLHLWVSFVEVYNDVVHDLLVSSDRVGGKARALIIAQDHRITYLKGVTEVPVFSAEDAYTVLGYGQRNLRYAHTKLNRQSSRSHCIFTIRMVRINFKKSENLSCATVSVFSFCDLAGSERFKKTQASGMRMKEGQSINRDLHFLHDVITILRNNQKAQEMNRKRGLEVVPYRNCKLTRLFLPFFTGQGRATMIVNISPCASVYDETLHVLRFASIAKQIVTSDVKDERTSELLYGGGDDDDDEDDSEEADEAGNADSVAQHDGGDGKKRAKHDATTVVKKKAGTPGRSNLSKRGGISASKSGHASCKNPIGTVTRAGAARHVQMQLEYTSPSAAPADMANTVACEKSPTTVRYAWMHSDEDEDGETSGATTTRRTTGAIYPWMRASKRALEEQAVAAVAGTTSGACLGTPEQDVAGGNKRQRVHGDAGRPSTAVRQSMGGKYPESASDEAWQRRCPFPEYQSETDPKVRGLLHVIKQLQDLLREEYNNRVLLEARVRRELVDHYEAKIDRISAEYEEKLEKLSAQYEDQNEKDINKTRQHALDYAHNRYAQELEDFEFLRAEKQAELDTAVKVKRQQQLLPLAEMSAENVGNNISEVDDESEDGSVDSEDASSTPSSEAGDGDAAAAENSGHADKQQRNINRLVRQIDQKEVLLQEWLKKKDEGDASVTEDMIFTLEAELEDLKDELLKYQACVSRRSTMFIQKLNRTSRTY